MPYSKKFSLLFGLMFCCFHVFANTSGIVVKGAELTPEGEVYKLNADLEIELDEKIKEAINKGVSVEFLYTFELVRPQSFWIDKKIVSTSTSISVSYHALSRQYLVSQSGRQTSHEILSEAMIELIQLYDWKVLERSMVQSNRKYKASLRVKLDQTKLPKAMQVEAIGSEDWNLASEKFEWVPKDLNR